MLVDKYLYQLGSGRSDYFIVPSKAGYTGEGGVKKIQDDTPVMHGSTRLNGAESDYKKDYVLKINMDVGINDNLNLLNKILYGEPFQAFFHDLDSSGDVKTLYFAYCECSEYPNFKQPRGESTGEEVRSLEFSLRLLSPFFYECGSQLKYFNESGMVSNEAFWGDGKTYWGQPGKSWGMTKLAAFPLLSTLTQTQINDFFLGDFGRKKPLVLDEPFFTRTGEVSPNLSLNLTTSVTAGNLTVITSSASTVFVLELDPLGKDESLTIKNEVNGSDLTITWIGPTPNPNRLQYNSHYGEVFDVLTKQPIPFYQCVTSFNQNLLLLDPLVTSNVFDPVDKHTLTFTKNSVASNAVALQFLTTHH